MKLSKLSDKTEDLFLEWTKAVIRKEMLEYALVLRLCHETPL